MLLVVLVASGAIFPIYFTRAHNFLILFFERMRLKSKNHNLMRITPANFFYAARNPCKAARYLRWRDVIPYDQISRYIPPNPVIVEAGASNGQNTAEMAEYWPGAQIHAFEPVPEARDALTARVSRYGNRVAVYPFALGKTAGEYDMHISGKGTARDSQSSSLLKPSGHDFEYSFVSFTKIAKVSVVRLDEWAAKRGIPTVHFLWLDMQGFELEAMHGAENLLSRVRSIHMEVANISLYEGAPLYPEVKMWMKKRGFAPVIEAVFRIGGNVLFTRI